jgi:hypothetical protein
VVRRLQNRPARLWEESTLKQDRRRRRSYASLRRSSAGPLLLSHVVGLAAGALTALVLVAGSATLGEAGSWLAVVTPLASAMVAAAAAGSILHWRKVGGRAAVHTGVIGTALLVLVAAQFVRVADLAALWRAGGFDALRSPALWTAALGLPSFSGAGGTAPGIAAVRELLGGDAVWVFLVVELALVVGLAWWMSGRALAAPLCVSCHTWCVRQRGVVARAGNAAAPDVVRQRATARDWRFFRELGPARGGPSLRFDLARCPSCERSNAVSVMWERPHWRDRCLVGDLRLGSDDMRTLRDLMMEAGPRPA